MNQILMNCAAAMASSSFALAINPTASNPHASCRHPPTTARRGIHWNPRLSFRFSCHRQRRVGRLRAVRFPPLRALPEAELPSELLEDAKFVPLNNDIQQFGPPAALLMGMPYADVVKVQEFLQNMGGDFMKVIICTKEMMKGTLWDAMNTSQPQLKEVKAVNNAPRICFLSGLTGEEIVMFVDAFPEASIGSVVFAALVPNNAQKSVEELVEEIMGDHERLTQNR